MVIIPDVHGRSFWRRPVTEYLGKEIIIFLGDYLDPYPYEKDVPADPFPILQEIVRLKTENPNDIVLLLGNHDLHYRSGYVGSSRFDERNHIRNASFFDDCRWTFQIMYESEFAGKKLLFSHAGVLPGWLNYNINMGILPGVTAETIADTLNEMWLTPSKEKRQRLLYLLGQIPYSRGGDYLYGSPVWSDVEDMQESDSLPGYYQVFGHTQQEYEPIITEHYACLDCRRAFRITDNAITEI